MVGVTAYARLYRYVSNMPTMGTDPSGQWAVPLLLWGGLGLLGLVGVAAVAAPAIVPNTDAGNNVDRFVAGWGDTLTFSGTTWARTQIHGDLATKNHTGMWFHVGQGVGVAHSLLLGFGSGRCIVEGARWTNIAIGAARAYDLIGIGVGMTQSGYKLANGGGFDVFDALNFLPAVGFGMRRVTNAFGWTLPCFTAEMEILARRGWVRWDQLTASDEVLSCNEGQPTGDLAWKRVEEIWFIRLMRT